MTNKKSSRSNLYRARRRLHNSLRSGGSENPPPEEWSRPATVANPGYPGKYHLLSPRRDAADAARLGVASEGEGVEAALAVLVRPVPKDRMMLTYRVTSGGHSTETREAMVGLDGVAMPQIARDLLDSSDSITVEWKFNDQQLTRVWRKQ